VEDHVAGVGNMVGIGKKKGGSIVMLKRLADWLEKISVAGFAVGIFQEQLTWGLAVGVTALVASMVMTDALEEKK
jgi:drug/metabolite transporter (DMT)-like permease